MPRETPLFITNQFSTVTMVLNYDPDIVTIAAAH
jgi:hypothetical protein